MAAKRCHNDVFGVAATELSFWLAAVMSIETASLCSVPSLNLTRTGRSASATISTNRLSLQHGDSAQYVLCSRRLQLQVASCSLTASAAMSCFLPDCLTLCTPIAQHTCNEKRGITSNNIDIMIVFLLCTQTTFVKVCQRSVQVLKSNHTRACNLMMHGQVYDQIDKHFSHHACVESI